jgi:hypothetical protein
MALKPKTVTQDGVKALALSLADASDESTTQALAFAYAGDAPDYFLEDCWLQVPEITKDVDTFYIYSTAYIESSFAEGSSDYARLDNPEMVLGALKEYVTNASVFEDSTNVFVPYYRQAGIRFAQEIKEKTGDIDAAISGTAYDDITAALDYYFEYCNEGRPFIIAGHSQGASMTKYVLKNYFKEHPDRYERMVAAYVIGFAVTKDDLAAYPHLKFAAGEADTGVVVSWNTESPKNVEENAYTAWCTRWTAGTTSTRTASRTGRGGCWTTSSTSGSRFPPTARSAWSPGRSTGASPASTRTTCSGPSPGAATTSAGTASCRRRTTKAGTSRSGSASASWTSSPRTASTTSPSRAASPW